MAGQESREQLVKQELERLRRGDSDSRNVDQETFSLILDSLPADEPLHWFCSRSSELTQEAAKFCIRIYAYNGARVVRWKGLLSSCLRGCAECVVGYQEAKGSTRRTYFGAFVDSVLDDFYTKLLQWEITTIADYVSSSLSTISTDETEVASNFPPGLVYHIISDVRISQHPQILSIIRKYLSKRRKDERPQGMPPAGVFVLLMDLDLHVRAWAQRQLSTYTTTPMPKDQYTALHADALAIANHVVGAGPLKKGFEQLLVQTSQDSREIWRGYSTFLRYIPAAHISSPMRDTVIAHLSDTGTHFVELLKAFLLILDRVGPDLWKAQPEGYSSVVFNTIKDNSAFTEALRTISSSAVVWMIKWIEPYVKSLETSSLSTVLPLIMQFLCEGLQHEMYDNIRPIAIQVATNIFYAVLQGSKDQTQEELQTTAVAWQTLDIHANIIASVAFGHDFKTEKWAEARTATRRLVRLATRTDIKSVLLIADTLSRPTSKRLVISPPRVREQLWRRMYEAFTPKDPDSVADILDILAPIAHVDRLVDDAYSDVFTKLEHSKDAREALQAVNHALVVFRSGFVDLVAEFTGFCSSEQVLDLLRRPGVVENLVALIFSPLDSVHDPAQSIIGVAFDVDSRLDCLRTLIGNFPNDAFDGMTNFLGTFATHASTVPEACSVSKSLALCLTDVIDVLCSTPNGLLHQTTFLKLMKAPGPVVLLPQWWSLMAKALVVIFQRTPRWSRFFENEVMVIWMRDALIFGRDMLAQRKVIETGALALSPQPSGKRHISDVGKKMVGNLQQVLFELTRWLRLTDEELLHQAFAFLQSLLSCFKETGISPEDTTLQKLQKLVNDARKDDSDTRTRLDSARLSRLQQAITSFAPVDDEVEIIDPAAAAAADDDEIQIIAHVSKKSSEKKPIRPTTFKSASTNKRTLDKFLAPVRKPSRPTQPARPQVAKVPLKDTFSKDDQKKLDSATSVATFKRSKPSTAGSEASSEPDWDRASVSSSTVPPEPSDSDESEDEGGVSLEQMARKPVVKKPVERRRVMMMDMPISAKNPALERLNKKEEARRVALRLKPDISSLHRTILSWNYEHDGPQPPGQRLELSYVPDKFADVGHYRRIFEPLLLMECWAQIQQSKEEPSDSYQTRVVNRQYTDDWVDLDIIFTESVQKEWFLLETDIVLMKTAGSPKSYLAKVQLFKNAPTGLQATIRIRLNESDHGPQSNTAWALKKVFSLTTLHREYSALIGLPYYDLCPTILKAELPKPIQADSRTVDQTMTMYSLNEPQAKAVASALRTDGFSLIQGPPGTGKTSTICGLVQAYIAQRPKPVTAINVGRNSGPVDKEPPKKILLCAPSNAAIDEITFRLKEGVSGPGRRVTPPKVVRVGAPRSMNISVKDVSLDALVEQKLNEDPAAKNTSKDSGSEIAILRSELEAVKRSRQQKLDEMASIHDNTTKTLALEEEVRKLNKQKANITHRLDKMRDQQKSDSRAMDAITRRYRAEVLFEADVICSTLAGAGHELLEPFDFELVVIDEAAQAIELSSLIPLKYRCSRCIMVGDPQQLPPTVISQEASKYGYNQSLFVRLQKHRPEAVHLLSIQYRMHPQISTLPSRLFYDGRLLDAPDMSVKTQRPWHTNAKFGQYRFYNISGVEQQGPFRSLVNHSEIQVAIALFNRLRQEYSNFDFDFKVGIVTMYRAQVTELRKAFEKRFGQNITGVVDFNTVDGFQGQEKDIIILSCVRAGPNLQTVGFLADVRRMNVALTRAKSSVFVLGNAATLERSDTNWKKIVHDARERSLLSDVDVTFFTASRLSSSRPAVQPPKRPSSKAIEPVLPDLVTPRELAAASSRASTSKAGDRTASTTGADDSGGASRLSSVHAGQKRTADELDSSKQPNGAEQGGAEERRQKPRPKKQKQAPSLFIPKKRPPPNGDPGPSANRRRI